MKILFVELLGGIGDLIIALPAIKALALTYPQSQVTVLTFPPYGELLKADPLIYEVVYAQKGEVRQAIAQMLAQQHFDIVVSDTNYGGIADIIRESGAQRTVTNLWRNPPDDQLVGDRFLQILQQEGLIAPEVISEVKPLIYLLEAEIAQAKRTFGAAYRPIVFLIPDAGMQIKRWSKVNFVTVAQALQQQYNATIVVAGGDEFACEIAQEIGESTRVWQRGTLRELAAGLAQADLAIAVDTGPARIAAALDVPTITLFGPSWHGRYGQPTPHVNLQGYLDCSERNIANFTEQSCWYSGICPFEWDSCTQEITPQQVLSAAAVLLQKQRSPLTLPVNREITNQWQNLRNILVMRLDNIGDVIMTSPVLRSIKENLPQAKLTLMVSPAGASTAPLLPWVDEVIPWRVVWQDLGRLDFDPAREWEMIEMLRQRQFDAAIILTSFSQSPYPAALACYLAGIPLRLGESKESGLGILTNSITPAPDEIHQVERNLRLIESVGFQVSDRRLSLHICDPAPFPYPYILLNPWTSCESRNYDTQRFAIAARQLAEITKLPIVVTGTSKDSDRAHPLLDILGDWAINRIGATSLSEFAAAIAHARLVLTNNTSAMHIADATNTPSVVLFAGTELECQWQPRYAAVKILRRPTVCNPCYTFSCPYELECLDISPTQIVAAGLELLSR
ncbi:glycosyl transferase family 9 [Chroococcidiopsis sp. TS-821]|uniref:glycosyltransferase family 9 protein n=2 Tax=Chroococcidiopsis sp. TS-821 TaxID=1378066 RepID=UPI000CEE6870|nr:glycosyltransferase family 9 protein [Chroococcidiopsis sp. TS-821]PPS42309.1 glycosyl transferase family 9 [Chroococcidiopsis sp. TS-821]